MCAWCATEDRSYDGAPDDFAVESWAEYFETSNQARHLEIATPHYRMYFFVNSKPGCYSVIGQRDMMLALFGWNAKISDKPVPINLKYKVELTRDSFLRVHAAVDYAEACQSQMEGHFPP